MSLNTMRNYLKKIFIISGVIATSYFAFTAYAASQTIYSISSSYFTDATGDSCSGTINGLPVCDFDPGTGLVKIVRSTMRYSPGFTGQLPAMGIGGVGNDGGPLGYIPSSYPFDCNMAGIQNHSGIGNSNGYNDGLPGGTCEISFNNSLTSDPSTGIAEYYLKPTDTTITGTWKMSVGSRNSVTGSVQDAFYVQSGCRITAPLTAANSVLSKGQTTTLSFGLNGNYPWTIEEVNGLDITSPPSGSGSANVSTNATDGTQTYRLVCNSDPSVDSYVTVKHEALPPICSPLTQDVSVNGTATLNATGGNGTFSWSAPGSTKTSGSGSSFSTSYSTTGTKEVIVDSNGLKASCYVNVTVSSISQTTGPSLCTAGEIGTGTYRVSTNKDYVIYKNSISGTPVVGRQTSTGAGYRDHSISVTDGDTLYLVEYGTTNTLSSVSVTKISSSTCPFVELTASPTSVSVAGNTTKLTWTPKNVSSCSASASPSNSSWSGSKSTSGGSLNVPVNSSPTNFVITCTDSLGRSVSDNVDVIIGTVATPSFTVEPSEMTFYAVQNEAKPPAQTVTVTNTGNVSLGISFSDNVSWMSLSDTGEVLAPGQVFSFKVNPGSTATAGTFKYGRITLNNNTYSIRKYVYPVTYIIADNPAPTVSLTATPNTVIKEDKTFLSWNVSGYGIDWCTGGSSPSDTTWNGTYSKYRTSNSQSSGSILADTIYTLTCANATGQTTATTTVAVQEITDPPTVSLTAVPADITSGDTTTLTWTVTGYAVESCTGNWGSNPKNKAGGSEVVSPGADTTYTLTCTNSAGNGTGQATVRVNSPASASCAPANASVDRGQTVTITGTVGGTNPTCSWTGGDNPATGSSCGSFTTAYSTTGNKTITLNVTASGGSTAQCSSNITVNEPPPAVTYTLNTERNGQGTITSNVPGINCGETCGGVFVEGSSVELTATPAPGWNFIEWIGDCTSTSGNICTVVVDGPRNITAKFRPNTTYEEF